MAHGYSHVAASSLSWRTILCGALCLTAGVRFAAATTLVAGPQGAPTLQAPFSSFDAGYMADVVHGGIAIVDTDGDGPLDFVVPGSDGSSAGATFVLVGSGGSMTAAF